MECTMSTIVIANGALIENDQDAVVCCNQGIIDANSELMGACEDTVEVNYSWVEEDGICTETTVTTIDGIASSDNN